MLQQIKGKKKKIHRNNVKKKRTSQSTEVLHNCTTGNFSSPCPEIHRAAQVWLNHTVVAPEFVWVMVIIVLCGGGFCCLVFLPCKINSQIALVGQQAWCGFYLPRTWGQRRRGKWLGQLGDRACNGTGVQSKGHSSQIGKPAWALADKSHLKAKDNPEGALELWVLSLP